MTARTSQAAFAVNVPDGRCANAESFKSVFTCPMIGCRRWSWSAVTVSRVEVVKNAWNRCVSTPPPGASGGGTPNVGCVRLSLFNSGIRRTTRPPGVWSFFALEVNAVKGTSATSAFEIQVRVVSSEFASVY